MPSTSAPKSAYLETDSHSSANSEILIDSNVFCQILAPLSPPRLVVFSFRHLPLFRGAK